MSTSSKRRQVLVIDPSNGFFQATESALRRLDRGLVVFHLPDGARAAAHLSRCGQGYPVPDLLLLDLSLPGAPTDMEILAQIRLAVPLSALPVLLTNGSDDEELIVQGRTAGADGYLIKPAQFNDHAAFAQQICAWCPEQGWRAALQSQTLGSGTSLIRRETKTVPQTPASALPIATLPPHMSLPDHPSLFGQVVGFVDWVKQTALESIDPFQLAFSQACRRHHLTPIQAMRGGGSHRLVANRRAVLVELLAAGWPDETLTQVTALSQTELKRLRKQAKARAS